MAIDLDVAAAEAVAAAETVEGLIRTAEVRLLFLAAALPTAEGDVLEIGSYKGRSTVALAKGARWAGQSTIVACDPFTNPATTDPTLKAETYEEFCAALDRHGVAAHVEVRRQFSGELAREWDRPLRLLWIDGDHTYEGVETDVAGFFPHLVRGAVVAFHDIGRKRFPGATRCFIEDVLLSDRFGACGMTEYTGWAQCVAEGGLESHRDVKSTAYRLLSARLGQELFGGKLSAWTRWRYRRFRKSGSFERWVRGVGRSRPADPSPRESD